MDGQVKRAECCSVLTQALGRCGQQMTVPIWVSVLEQILERGKRLLHGFRTFAVIP